MPCQQEVGFGKMDPRYWFCCNSKYISWCQVPTESDSEDGSNNKTYKPKNTLPSEDKSSRISKSDVQAIPVPTKNKKPSKKKPKVSFEMVPWHMIISKLWCSALRDRLWCAAQLKRPVFPRFLIPFSKNAPFYPRNISSEPILLKVKNDRVIILSSPQIGGIPKYSM